MDNLSLMSNANGTWEYEIEEGKDKSKRKVSYKITPGFNEIPGSHVETLEKDAGYRARKKQGTYEILKGKEAVKASKVDETEIEAAKSEKEAKANFNTQIADIKKANDVELKRVKEQNRLEVEGLLASKAELAAKVKKLEDERLGFVGQLAELKGEYDQQIETLNKQLSDQKTDSESVIASLKLEGERKVKTLDGKITALDKQVKAQAEEIKGLKAKK